MNFVVIRENSEGLYSGAGGFNRKARPRGRRPRVDQHAARRRADPVRVRRRHEPTEEAHVVHKTNVLTFAGDLYQRVFNEVAAEYPDVQTDYVHVDACCIFFLDELCRFDVIVTDNMFGDIITDLGAMTRAAWGSPPGHHQPVRRRACPSRSWERPPMTSGRGPPPARRHRRRRDAPRPAR